jgi:hypothetical protein
MVLVLAGPVHTAHPRRPGLHNCEVSAYTGSRLAAWPGQPVAGEAASLGGTRPHQAWSGVSPAT